MENILRIQVNATCFAVIAVIVLALERRVAGRSSERIRDIHVFRGLAYSTLLLIVLDTACWILDGVPGGKARTALWLADSLCLGLYPAPISMYILYADFQIYRDLARESRLARPLAIIAAVIAAFSLSSPFLGWLFRLDVQNRFQRGPAFAAFAVALSALVVWAIVIVVAGRKRVSAKVFWTLILFPAPVAAAAAARYLSYGIVLVWPVTTVFLVAAAFNIQRTHASTDHLTGVANRRSLDEELDRLVEAARPGRSFGGMMIDLDEFKSINDRLGHEAGDCALEDIAAILRASVRSDDIVARFGGDEFVILAPNATLDALAEMTRRLRRKIEAHNASCARPYRLAVSVGAALFEPGSGASADFLAVLDRAMYLDKGARKAATGSVRS